MTLFEYCDFLDDPKHRWKRIERQNYAAWGIGAFEAVFEKIIQDVKSGTEAEFAEIVAHAFSEAIGNFALIIRFPNDTFLAAVDRVRGYPVYYAQSGAKWTVSNSARMLQKNLKLSTPDELSVLEFCTSGYVTDKNTLYEGLCQLEAGSFLIMDASGKPPSLHKHSNFKSIIDSPRTENSFLEELHEAMTAVFKRISDRCHGKRIWIPLSGGWDSRLVAALLKAAGHADLHCFTYGPANNSEMKVAKTVASRLGIPWIALPESRADSRRNFWEDDRHAYWNYADGLASVPVMADYHSLKELIGKNAISHQDVIINGQSGDFVSGGHLPSFEDAKVSANALFEKLCSKHFSLWKNLTDHEHCMNIRNKFFRLTGINENDILDRDDAMIRHENWEWQERQSKYVVNGQRKYDYLGLAWELPLWDREIFEFWKKVPVKMKMGQALFEKYLMRFDPGGVFKNVPKSRGRWPGFSGIVPWLAKSARILFGKSVSESIYKKFLYWGHYSPFYAPYGYRTYLKYSSWLRNPVSLHVRQWMLENGVEGPRIEGIPLFASV